MALSLLELIATKTALQTSTSVFNCALLSYYSTISFNFKFQIHTSNLKLQLQSLTSDLDFKCQPHTLDSESTSNFNFKSQHWTSAPNFKFKPQRQLQRSFSKSTLNFHSKIQQSQTSTSKSNFNFKVKLWCRTSNFKVKHQTLTNFHFTMFERSIKTSLSTKGMVY